MLKVTTRTFMSLCPAKLPNNHQYHDPFTLLSSTYYLKNWHLNHSVTKTQNSQSKAVLQHYFSGPPPSISSCQLRSKALLHFTKCSSKLHVERDGPLLCLERDQIGSHITISRHITVWSIPDPTNTSSFFKNKFQNIRIFTPL